jgi:DtxR family transcriptional regulator, Mn-dependent transcriptional regulator
MSDKPGKSEKPHRPSPTIEDYLTILYILERDGEEVISARVAEALEVSPPTVTITLKRMERDGWVQPHDRRGVRLSDAGREAARNVLRRHMLTEWLLTRILHIPWSRTHIEAHNLEHTISEEIEAHMKANLDDPQTCPHGNPLPGYEYVTAGWIPLTRLEAGERVILRRIHELAEDNNDLIRFLEVNSLFPGAVVDVVEVLDFNQTVTLRAEDKLVTLGFAAARYLYAERGAAG